jgi:biotin carboxyl carrier protein
MNSSRLQSVMQWFKTTDLLEIQYRAGTEGFELRSADASPAIKSGALSNRYVPVCADTVGLFQSNRPGEPKLGQEGLTVREGDLLGLIQTGVGEPHPVLSPCRGRVARAFIEAGQAVEYGQPLFFMEREG